jgi:N-acetylmuramoyl-L-alanine amidase
MVVSGFMEISGQGKTWIIVIDPGHGGKDPGALGSFEKEKNINLAIALKAGEYLEQNLSNVKVLYTRKEDVFVEVIERAAFANRNKADLFISIHANAISKKNIKGTETWIMGPAKDEQNLEVAMKENEVIQLEDDFTTKYEGFDPKSPESYIMFTVMQNIYKEQSTLLASDIQDQFRNRAGRNDLGVKQAGFLVLYMTTMPSVLIETGFLTNLEEEKFLTSGTGQDYIASAIYRACRSYINELEKRSMVSQEINVIDAQPSDTVKEPISDSSSDIVTFAVQIASSVKRIEITPENFKGINNVREIFADNRYKYATGSFTDYQETVNYWRKIRGIIPDAFVIALQGNKVLPLEEAKKLIQQK